MDSFTSLPPQEEQAFVVFEQKSRTDGKRAMTMGWIVAAAAFAVTLIVVFAFKPAEIKHLPDEKPTASAEAH